MLIMWRYASIQLACLLVVFFLSGMMQCVYASPSEKSNTSHTKRPKIGLVLSGGGARGSAHVGVLKILEQNHIPIDYIAGTSMGSVIGALYASGMTPDEITQALAAINWNEVFNDGGPRKNKTMRDKVDERLYQVDQQIGVKEGVIHFPTALIQGQRFELILRKLLLQASMVRNFDNLPIPFRAVATDITTGEEVVLGKGDLSVAVRASMAVPGAFSAVEIDGRLLVDGGMSNNLPVSVVRTMGADIVIAIDISTPLLKRDELTDGLSIIDQLTGLLTRDNAERQIADLSGCDIFIVPELGALTASDFNRYEKAITAGSKAATKQLAQLKPLSISSLDYAKHMLTHNTDYFQQPVIDFIRINNNSEISDKVLRDRLNIEPGDVLDTDAIDQGINEIYTLGIYSHVGYSIIKEKDKMGLLVTVKEKEWGASDAQFGVNITSDFNGSSSLDFSAAYTHKPMSSLNAEWRTILLLGENSGIFTEWYQPLDSRETYFVNPIISYTRNTFNVFAGNDILAKFQGESSLAELWVGRNLFNQASRLRFGIIRGKGNTDLLIGHAADFSANIEALNVAEFNLEFLYDGLNTVSFPSKGSAIEVTYVASRESIGADTDSDRASLVAVTAYPAGTDTLLLAGRFDKTLKGSGVSQLGGFLNLSGLQQNQLIGQHSGLLIAAYMHKLNKSNYFNAYIGASLEVGNAWVDSHDISLSNTLTAGSVFIGVDSPVGPVYVAYGAAEGGEKSLYLIIGSPWF